MTRRPVLHIAVLVAAATLAGCATPAPEPTAVFASDEEALAAAQEVLVAYSQATSDYYGARTTDRSTVLQFLTPNAATVEAEDMEDWRSAGYTLVGTSKYSDFVLDNVAPLDPLGAQIEVHFCVDISETHVVDEGGKDVTPANRPLRFVKEVTLLAVESGVLIEMQESSGESC